MEANALRQRAWPIRLLRSFDARASRIRRDDDPQLLPRGATAPDVVAHRDWTRRWWTTAHERYELVTRPAVLDELSGGDPSRVAERLALVERVPLLAIDPSVAEIVETYIRHKMMPADPGGDAVRLAVASTASATSW